MSWKGLLIRAAGTVLSPQECVLCRAWVVNSGWTPLCRLCLAELQPIWQPVCHYCGVPVPGALTRQAGCCCRCRRSPPPFDWARGWGIYEGELRKLIHAFKFERQRRLAAPLGDLLADAWSRSPAGAPPDWIIPIPCHSRRRRKRGFDQSVLAARRLSRRLGRPLFHGLNRCRETLPQPGLARAERRRNLRGAFGLNNAHLLADRSVLIVDDVMTSGTTVREAAELLRREGKCKNLGVLVVGRAKRFFEQL